MVGTGRIMQFYKFSYCPASWFTEMEPLRVQEKRALVMAIVVQPSDEGPSLTIDRCLWYEEMDIR